jgi:hypothetical protein
MHCDLLFKVNTLEVRNEFRPLTFEIPKKKKRKKNIK